MSKHTYYTAVGHFRIERNGPGKTRPVILVNSREYYVDIQEMSIWTALNWRLMELEDIMSEYNRLDQSCVIPAYRTPEDCLGRLVTRGLVASGTGETCFEALYDLLSGLYVVPLSKSILLRTAAFLKLTVIKGSPVAKAWQLLRRDHPTGQEAQLMALSRQALLSTAELIKCAELDVRDVSTDEKLMDALYNDDYTTSDNIADMMSLAQSRENVTMAIANLYLRKQIVFERVS